MRHLQLTLPTPPENLALDEALLDAAEAGELEADVLRIWELPQYCVVLGRSSAAEVEVDWEVCRRDGVPVLRRASGGGTVLAGPGCLMYSLILSSRDHPQLQTIGGTHQFVLDRMSQLLASLGPDTKMAGTSDLALRQPQVTTWRKFSGNSLRIKRHHVLYHGTLLYDFNLPNIERWLAAPTRTPEYREDRRHEEFVTNLGVEKSQLVETLIAGWNAEASLSAWPQQRTASIVADKYTADPKWRIFTPDVT